MKTQKFTFDGEKSYNGFSLDQKWNGFEVPYFVFDVAVQILDDMIREKQIKSFSFNLTTKEITIIDEYDEPEIISVCIINKVYTWPIGGNGWTWTIL